MITISHTQAQRLIASQLDERKLPEAQWTAIHAHLESCPDCRAYRERLSLAERRLRRGLRQRWDRIDGPLIATSKPLAALYHERWVLRRLGRRMLGGAAAFLLGVLLLIGWSAFFAPEPPPETAAAVPPATATPAPTPTPTHVPSDYKGLLAYEYRKPVDSASAEPAPSSPGEIYLLNTGAEPSNLTNNPADDHDPAWSPDGEFLAFLSDRTGKDEVYVSHLSGSRLAQLTDLPGVTWRGPLSWSADGKMLALIGERTIGENTSPWVYLVPLDGSNAYPLGRSQGAVRTAFSPMQPLLAFSGAEEWKGGLAVYNFAEGREHFMTVDRVEETPYQRADPGVKFTVDRFEWSKDGTRLLFRDSREYLLPSSGATVTEARLRSVTILANDPNTFQTSQVLNRNGNRPANYASFSWTGIKNEYAYLDGPVEDGCQTIQFGLTSRSRKIVQPAARGFCVEGDLTRFNWQVTDKSVIVTARELDRPGERGIYVIRFRGDSQRAEWMADARGVVGTALLRPEGKRLAIDPRPVAVSPVVVSAEAESAGAESAPPALPGPGAGLLLTTRKMNDRTLIETLDPASGERVLLNQSIGENRCPTWSPDRSRIAFLSNREDPLDDWTTVYVMDSSGLNAKATVSGLGFGCPSWSPDGQWLALPERDWIPVVPVEGKANEARYLYASSHRSFVQLIGWLADNRLLAGEFEDGFFVIKAYEPERIDYRAPTGKELLRTSELGIIHSASVSPDGQTILFNAVKENSGEKDTGWLYTTRLESSTPGIKADRLAVQSRFKLPEDGGYIRWVGWLPNSLPGYLVNYPDGRRVKTALFALPLEKGRLPWQIAAFEDVVTTAVQSDDLRWLTVLTETGRYVLDLEAENPTPVWVGPEIEGIWDW